MASARKAADREFKKAAGRPAALVAQAKALRWTTELTERARYEAIQRERLAWDANKYVYMMDRWLDVWDEILPPKLKYVLGVERDRVEIWLDSERKEAVMEGVFTKPESEEKK